MVGASYLQESHEVVLLRHTRTTRRNEGACIFILVFLTTLIDGRIILKIDIREASCEGGGMDWIDLAQNMDGWRAGSCKCGTEPSGFVIFREILD
jgi:hypothetical protein